MARITHISLYVFFIIFSPYSFSQYVSTPVDPLTRTLDKTTAKVGTLPGSLDVNSFGAASYAIPILVSPGTAGMQPKISVVYNHTIDDGIMGKGWAVGGLSEIRRVSQNFYNDNNNTGVTLQNTDRFVLDSIRLILTSQHQYGADNSEYATESETFVRVIAHGTAGTGPSWFEVKTKDGNTIEYGNTTDSKVEAYGSTTVYMWRINKVTDANGNSMEYEYYEINGESYIKQINYTQNTSAGLTANYNAVKFLYYTNSRTDVNIKYVAGRPIPQTKLLSSIRIETEGGSLVREYQFLYHLDVFTHLNQIIEKGSDNTTLNATVFGWGITETSTIGLNVFNNSIKDKFYFGDFNGDGRMDFITTEDKTSFTTSDKWKLYYANTQGTGFSFINEGYLNPDYKGFTIADVDGNGNDDVLWRKRETTYYQCNPHLCSINPDAVVDSLVAETSTLSQIDLLLPPPEQDTCWDACSYQSEVFYYYYCNESSGLTRGSSSYDLLFENAPADITLQPADIDGDGEMDYIVFNANKSIYSISGTSSYGYPYYITPTDVRLIDFDGNNKKDLLVISSSGCSIYQLNTSTHYWDELYTSTTYPGTSDRIFTGDFNGDKKTDLISWKNSSWSLKLSTGISYETASNPALYTGDPNSSLYDYNYYTGDFNGDRIDDIVEVFQYGSNSRFKMFYSRGGGQWDSETMDFLVSSIYESFINIRDFNGDGQMDIFYYDNSLTSNYAKISFFHKDELKHVVKSISNGFNLKTLIAYRRINDDADTSFYKKTSSSGFPVYDYNGAMYVVSAISVGDSIWQQYRYQGAKIHRQGKGFLGFFRTKIIDGYHHFQNTSYYTLNSNYYRRELYKQTYMYSDFYLINESLYVSQLISYPNKRFFPYTSQITERALQKDVMIVTNNTFDDYGNLTLTSASYKNLSGEADAIKSVTNTYESKGNYGIPNKVVFAAITSQYTGQGSYSRSINYTYDTKGNLTISKSDPSTANEVTKTNTINSYGLPDQEVISASGIQSRSTTYGYDAKYRFVTSQTNTLGSTYKTYFPGTGNVNTSTDINNKVTSFTYDGFGRLLTTTTPTANTTTESLYWTVAPDGGDNALYANMTTTPGKPLVKNYFDKTGGVIKSCYQGPSGDMVCSEIEQSAFGVYRKSEPHFIDDPPSVVNWLVNSYDIIGRLSSTASEKGGKSYSYNERTTTETLSGNFQKETTVNALGDVVSIKENNSSNLVTSYEYHSNGNVKQISSAGNTVTTVYDNYGNATSIASPNSGTQTYTYNALGEMISSAGPNPNDSVTYAYDNLGRIDYYTSLNGSTEYSYVQTGNGKGQLSSISSPNQVSYSYSYDEFGRLISSTDNIHSDSKSFTTSFGYDSYDNNISVSYPEGFSIQNIYAYGYLNEIRKADNTLIWKLEDVNGQSQPLQYSFGPNNIQTSFAYDTLGYLTKKITSGWKQTFKFENYSGNLLERGYRQVSSQDSIRETFTYDNLRRLTSSTVFGQAAVSIDYYSNGNIDEKTDVGTYEYHESKINAVEHISNDTGAISETPQSITYSYFNKPLSITEGLNEVTLTYGPDMQRVKSVYKEDEVITRTKYYSTNFEQEQINGSPVKYIYYIYCPYGLVAINIKQNNTDNLYLTETDHLGSIIGLIKPDGSVQEKYSFDPWGRRRNPTDWTFSGVASSFLTDRGFTGHEHLDEFSLINMNGRVYDPVVGRFLSADPIIQAPDFSQSFNSYSYCFNNPLIYVDPSGYVADAGPGWLERIISQIFGNSCKIISDNTTDETKFWSWLMTQIYNLEINFNFQGGDRTGTHPSGYGSPSDFGFAGPLNTLLSEINGGIYPFMISEGNSYSGSTGNAYSFNMASGQGGRLLSPVDTKYPITSPYIEGNRVIPELGINRPHLAIDIGTPVGTPIRSPYSGKVVMAQDTKYGLSVIVKHDYQYNGQYIQTGYAHLSEMNVTNGLTINRGDVIGYTGTWGTGPHLHFTLRIGVQKVNPTILFPYNE